MHQLSFYLLTILLLTSACADEMGNGNPPPSNQCPSSDITEDVVSRDFKMGFSTWSFGPSAQNVDDTYDYILSNGDIYSEQVDGKIPWESWINGTTLPIGFVENIDFRVNKKDTNLDLVMSVSLLNLGRDGLAEDWESNVSPNINLNDQIIEDAYFLHLQYLINRLQPNYLVAAMETNEMLIKSPTKWQEYKILMTNIRGRIKQAYPDLPWSESITLHNYLDPETEDQNAFISEISNYISGMDFAAISFYPFLKGFNTAEEFQIAFDFLHDQVNIPIAVVETNHIAETLNVSSFNLNIPSDQCEQREYLETLISNAHEHNYDFIIWWAHRDYDLLWETFPEEVKDIGKLWRDTGLIDENGEERIALAIWNQIFAR